MRNATDFASPRIRPRRATRITAVVIPMTRAPDRVPASTQAEPGYACVPCT